jgi:hypothetical protein
MLAPARLCSGRLRGRTPVHRDRPRAKRGARIGIGGSLTALPLPHHRACGSAHGGSAVKPSRESTSRPGLLFVSRQGRFEPSRTNLRASPFRLCAQASRNWIFCRHSSLRFTLTSLPPFGPSGFRLTMPAADFCSSIGSPSDFPSPDSGTDACRSPEVSSTAFPAQSPNLRSALLMDTDFAITSWLVPRSRLISGSCSSTRSFAPRFFQTGLAAYSLRFANLHLHQVGRRLSLPSGRTCSAHTVAHAFKRGETRSSILVSPPWRARESFLSPVKTGSGDCAI